MKSYLLLRDNRESGPYTLEELKKQSLKQLDLIWIEGQSTSWKYPSEIPELRRSVAVRRKTNHLNTTHTATSKKPVANTTEVQPILVTEKVPVAEKNIAYATPYSGLPLYEDEMKELF